MKKILITGFPHCGTSILKCILGHIDDVYEVVPETPVVRPEHVREAKRLSKKYILIKWPKPEDLRRYSDYYVIFLIRNPYYLYASLSERFGVDELGKLVLPPVLEYHRFGVFERVMKQFVELRKETQKGHIFCLRYEDMFPDNFDTLRQILDRIGLSYGPEIFNNQASINRVTYIGDEKVKEMLEEAPPVPRDNRNYRNWQVNQPFTNRNDLSKLTHLTGLQRMAISESPYVAELYGDQLTCFEKL